MIASLSYLEALCLNVTFLMRLTIAFSKIKKKRNDLVLINNATYQRETLSERPIRQPLMTVWILLRIRHLKLNNVKI